MDFTTWSVFLAITGYLLKCADSKDDGDTFLVTFFPEATETHLFLTSCNPGSCDVSYDDGKRKTITVQLPGDVVTAVDMSGSTTMPYGVHVVNKAILVNCTVPSSVYAYNYGHSYATTDAYTGQPIKSDFTSYIVPSAQNSAVLGIAALESGTHVTVTVNSTCDYTFNGTTFKSGDIISLHLKAMDVLGIGKTDSDRDNHRACDLGGTRVVSDKPVAVYSGSTSLVLKDDGGHAMTQILPTSHWSREFVVPSPQGDAVGHVVRVTAGHDDTVVTIGVPGGGTTPEQIHLNAGEHYDKVYDKESTFISSSKPVQVTQYVFNYFHSFENVIHGTDSYKTNYTATTMDRQNTEYNDFVNIVTTKGCENDIVMEGNTASTLSWSELGPSNYTVGSASIPAGTFHARSKSGNCRFSLQVSGYSKWIGEAYGYTAVLGCHLPTTTMTPPTTTTFMTPQPDTSTPSTTYRTPDFLTPQPDTSTPSTTYRTPDFMTPQPDTSTPSTTYRTPDFLTPKPDTSTPSTTYRIPDFMTPQPDTTTTSTTYRTPSFLTPKPETSTPSTTYEIPTTEAPTSPVTSATSLQPEELLKKAINFTCTTEGWDIDVDVDLLKQLYPNLDPTLVFLSNDMCQGHYGPVDNVISFHFTYGECLTTETETKSDIIYKNFLFYPEVSANVIEAIDWQYDLVCYLKRNEVEKIEYNPHVQVKVHGQGSGTVQGHEAKMSFFNDSSYQVEIKGNPLNIGVGSTIYVRVVSPGNEGNKMVVQNCTASPIPNLNGGNAGLSGNVPQYPLILNKCVTDKSTTILDATHHVFRFSFQALEFRKQHGDIFISCDVHFCTELDFNSDCVQSCQH